MLLFFLRFVTFQVDPGYMNDKLSKQQCTLDRQSYEFNQPEVILMIPWRMLAIWPCL